MNWIRSYKIASIVILAVLIAVFRPLYVYICGEYSLQSAPPTISARTHGKVMENLKFLDEFSGQSVDELLSLEGAYRIDSLVLAFEQAIARKAAKYGMQKLSEEELPVLAVEALEREVNNGGYLQFFTNSSIQFTPIIVESLKRINCPKTAHITQKAIDALGVTRDITVENIDNATRNENKLRDEQLNECDDIYYRSNEHIEAHLFAFIKNNRDKIKF